MQVDSYLQAVPQKAAVLQKSLAAIKRMYRCFDLVPGKMHPWLQESLRKEYKSLLCFYLEGGMFYVNLAAGGKDVGKLPSNDFFGRTNAEKSLRPLVVTVLLLARLPWGSSVENPNSFLG